MVNWNTLNGQRQERQQAILNAERDRARAMDNGARIEKISYLLPSAFLWAVYAFSPLITYISLSLRVSQNILLIGSATHLFAQSFFRGPAAIPEASNLLPANPSSHSAANKCRNYLKRQLQNSLYRQNLMIFSRFGFSQIDISCWP